MQEEYKPLPNIFNVQSSVGDADVVSKKEIFDYSGEKLGYTSRFPTYDPYTNLEDKYAKEQGFWGTLGNAAGQFVSLGVTTFANHFSTYGRDVSSLVNGEAASPDIDLAYKIRGIQNAFPIFETKEQQAMRDSEEGGLGAALADYVPFTGRAGNAWANLFGQLGFTAGTIAAVGAESLAISAATGGNVGAGVARAATNLTKARSIRSLYELTKTGKDLSKISTAAKSTNLLATTLNNPLTTTYRMVQAAKGEGWIEGQSARLDYIEDQIELLGGNVTPEQFQEIDERSLDVAANVYLTNIPIVMAGNLFTIGGLFKPKNFAKIPVITDIVKRDAVRQLSFLSEKGVINETLKKYPKLGMALGAAKSVKEAVPEGIEEFMQGVSSRFAQEHFSLLNENVSQGLMAQAMGMADEISRSIDSREAWNEFAAGMMTGGLIGGGKSIANRYNTAQATPQTKKVVENLTNANTSYMNALKQAFYAEQQQVQSDEGNIRQAKDSKAEQEIALIEHLNQYGVFDNYIDNLADNLKAAAEQNPSEFSMFLQDRNIDEAVSSLKEKNKEYEQVFNVMSKNVGNPFSVKDKEFQQFETAKRKAVSIHMLGKDALNRGKNLQQEISTKFSEIDSTILNAIADPKSLFENLPKVRQVVDMKRQALQIEGLSPQEKELRQAELQKEEEKLAVLEKLEKSLKDTNSNIQEQVINSVLINAYGDEKTAPKEVKKLLEDLAELELEGRQYLDMYNLLNDKELFSKFGKSFIDSFDKAQKQVVQKMDKVEVAPTETLSQEELEEAIGETEDIGNVMGVVKDLAENVTLLPNGKYEFEGKEYDKQGLKEALNKKYNTTQEQLDKKLANGDTIDQAIEKRINSIEEKQVTPQEKIQQAPKVASKVRGLVELAKPKTLAESKNEGFRFVQTGAATLLHFYDYALSLFIEKDYLKKVMKKLPTTQKDSIEEIIQEFNREFTVVMVNLIDSVKENPRFPNVRVVNDGIRSFVIVKGTENIEAQIEEALDIKVERKEGFAVIKTKENAYKPSSFKKEEDDSKHIHALKKGYNLTMVVADSEYNRNLDKKNTDKLEIKLIDGQGKVVGYLRAADFIFDENDSGEVKRFRESLKGKVIGDEVGHVPVKNFSTLRNTREDILSLNEFDKQTSLGNWKTEYFYVEKNGNVIDTNGETVNENRFDRASLAYGAVYVRVSNQEGKYHVTQVFSDNLITKEEFLDKTFKEKMSTNLDPYLPIISKRVIISLKDVQDQILHDNKQQEIKKQFDDVEVTDVEETGAEKTSAVQKEFEQYKKDKEKENSLRTELSDAIYQLDRDTLEKGYKVKEDNKYSQFFADNAIKEAKNDIGRRENINLLDKLLSLRMPESISDQYDKDFIPSLRAKLKELRALEDKYKGKTEAEFQKRLEESKEFPPLKKNIRVIFESGLEENLNGAYIEGDKLIADNKEHNLTEISKIESQQEEIVEERFEDITDVDRVIDWLLENAEQGVTYTTSDGTKMRVAQRTSKGTYIDTDGDLYLIDQDKNQFVVTFERGKAKTEKGIDNEFSNFEARQSDLFKKIKLALSTYTDNVEPIMMKLKIAYQQSILDDSPITTLQGLLEAANIDPTDIEAFNFVITPAFQPFVWEYIANSESIFDAQVENQWEKFRENISPTLEFLELVNIENTPAQVHQEDMQEQERNLLKLPFGIRLPLTIMSKSELLDFVARAREVISIANAKEGIERMIQEFEVDLKGKAEIKRNKAQAEQLLRAKPIKDFNTDLDLMSKGYVINETTNVYQPLKEIKNISEKALKIQKNYLSLLGVEIPIEYLANYESINGGFSILTNRMNQYKQTVYNYTDNGIARLNKEQLISEEDNYIVAMPNKQYIEVGNTTYAKIAQVPNGNSIYVKMGTIANPKKLNEIMQENGLRKPNYQKVNSMGQTMRFNRAVKTTIQNTKNCN